MAEDISLQLPGGVKVLNPVPLDPRTRTTSLSAIENDPTYQVGFSPIYDEETGFTYTVAGGNVTIGWIFEKMVSTTNTSNTFSDQFKTDSEEKIALNIDYVTINNYFPELVLSNPAELIASPSLIGNIAEGSIYSFANVVLGSKPTANVDVILSSSDETAVTVIPTLLTFTPEDWDTPQTLDIEAIADVDSDSENVTITVSLNGSSDENYDIGALPDQTISCSVIDSGDVGLLINPSSLNINEGGSGIVRVSLASDPVANGEYVEVTLTNPNPTVLNMNLEGQSVSNSITLQFDSNNYNTIQNIELNSIDDIIDLDTVITISINVVDNTTNQFYSNVTSDGVGITIINTTAPTLTEVQIGDLILAQNNMKWTDGGTGIYAPDNDENNVEKYGYLYSKEAATRLLQAYPGYRIMTSNDLESLKATLGINGNFSNYTRIKGEEVFDNDNTMWSDIETNTWNNFYQLNIAPAGLKQGTTYAYFNRGAFLASDIFNSETGENVFVSTQCSADVIGDLYLVYFNSSYTREEIADSAYSIILVKDI